MKKTLLSTFSLFAALATVFLFTANTAEAKGHSHGVTKYLSHYSPCGCPVYKTKVFRYHDRYGRPVYSYYTQPVSHKCKPSKGYHHGHSKHGHKGHKGYKKPKKHSSHNGYSYNKGGFSIIYRR